MLIFCVKLKMLQGGPQNVLSTESNGIAKNQKSKESVFRSRYHSSAEHSKQFKIFVTINLPLTF